MYAPPMHKLASPPLSTARLRVLEAVQSLGSVHVTIAQLAEHLGGHPNASRPHLTALACDGLITVADIPGEGPGRRPRGHSLTTAGRSALSPTAEENRGLAGTFASYLISGGTASTSHRVWGEQPAQTCDEHTAHPVDAVVEVLDILGFDPARLDVPNGQALVLRSCPLTQAGDPTIACEAHHGIVDGILRRLGAPEGVALLPLADDDGGDDPDATGSPQPA